MIDKRFNLFDKYNEYYLKNNSLVTTDVFFIKKLDLLIFHFSDLRNLVKCMGSMFPCYSVLNMKVI